MSGGSTVVKAFTQPAKTFIKDTKQLIKRPSMKQGLRTLSTGAKFTSGMGTVEHLGASYTSAGKKVSAADVKLHQGLIGEEAAKGVAESVGLPMPGLTLPTPPRIKSADELANEARAEAVKRRRSTPGRGQSILTRGTGKGSVLG
jgi:hypothetical protein